MPTGYRGSLRQKNLCAIVRSTSKGSELHSARPLRDGSQWAGVALAAADRPVPAPHAGTDLRLQVDATLVLHAVTTIDAVLDQCPALVPLPRS
eukprot:4525708-Pyramimonas_sp.AAC.1